jgi:hypothetical protein
MPRTVKPPKKAVGPNHVVKGDMDPRVMNQLRNMMVSSVMDQLSSTSSGRSALARRLGYEYQGDRDVYTALGYTKDLKFEDYQGKFDRGDMARRIVKEPVQSTWRSVPEVNETLPEEKRVEGERTLFEEAWDELSSDKNLKVWHNIRKVDLVSGIGRWGVMFLGFSDAQSREDFAEEVTKGSKLLYITPLNEAQAQVSTFVKDPTDPRFGEPEFYELQFQSLTTSATTRTATPTGESGSTASVRVHWSRIVHVAEEADENGVVGTPRLQPVYNRLTDLDRVVGSSGEAFWRNAFPMMQFKLDSDYQFSDEQDLDDLKSQIEKMVHRWERYIRTKGVTVEQMETDIAKPKESFEVIVSTISSATSIPQRILLGSERGELASSQDQTQYGILIEERRKQYVEPVIMDEFIGRLVMVGTLPMPPQGWAYVWPDVFTPSEKDRAEVAKNRTEMLVKYADSFNAGGVVPLNMFLRSEKFMGFSEEEAKKIEELIGQESQDALEALGREADDIDDMEGEAEEEV